MKNTNGTTDPNAEMPVALEGADTAHDRDRPAVSLRQQVVLVLLFVSFIFGVTPALLSWKATGEERALSLSHIRRLAQGALMYSQDWDARPPACAQCRPDGSWLTWPTLLKPYISSDSVFNNPSNPVAPFHNRILQPDLGYEIDSSYAMNRRFWDTFGKGPFPIDNIELPGQTALFVEAGPMWYNPKRAIHETRRAFIEYGDMLDRYSDLHLCPYPSTHDGKMAVAAADGHGVMVSVEHYDPGPAPHDSLYGRIGGSIYNWNGGHPNGETDGAPRE